MTLYYRAPEVLLDNLFYTKEIDHWSAGVIIYELLCGKQMFRGQSEIDMIIKIFHCKGTPKEDPLKEVKKKWHTSDDKTTANSSKAEPDAIRPIIANLQKYPHLKDYGCVLPQFEKMPLEEFNPFFKQVDNDWIVLIDGLTNLDPFKRTQIPKALQMLAKIENKLKF